MWKWIIVSLLIFAMWFINRLIFGKRKPQKKNSPLKDPRRELKTEQILGKSLFKVGHSQTEVSTYAENEKGEKKEYIFAPEKGKELSDNSSEEEFDDESEQPNIDRVLFHFGSENEEYNLNLGEEEDLVSTSDDKQSEHGSYVEADSLIAAFNVLNNKDASPDERAKAADVFDKLTGCNMLTQLRSNPKRAAKIDELINERFAQLEKIVESRDDSNTRHSLGETDGFNIKDYLPD